MCLSVALAACAPQAATSPSPGSPAPLPSPASASPQAAKPTSNAAATKPATPVATLTAGPADTPAAPEAPTAPPLIEPPTAVLPEASCTSDARFVRDVTVPDGSQFLPGQPLLKKWGMQNTGTCNWGPNYRLVLIGGDSLAATSEVALYPARAGTDAIWEIPMVAPQTPGAYTSRWQARDPAGNLFGAVVFIKITVIPMPTAPSP